MYDTNKNRKQALHIKKNYLNQEDVWRYPDARQESRNQEKSRSILIKGQIVNGNAKPERRKKLS